MPTVFLMCGLSFSGKSTLAHYLVESFELEYISLDDINRERGLGFGGHGIAEQQWEESHHIAHQRLRALMERGVSVVIDDTYCFHWLRERVRNIANEYYYTTKVIYLDIPIDIIRNRIRENMLSKQRATIYPEIFNQLVHVFEAPTDEENMMTYSNEETFAEWVTTMDFFGA